MTDEEFRKHNQTIVGKCVSDLMAHFDNVQIFVTRVDDGMTMGYARGDGNWYARIGHVTEWINAQHQPGDEEEEES